jgi:hypothetical protein
VDGKKSDASNEASAISGQLAQMSYLSLFPLPTKTEKEQRNSARTRRA